MSTQKIKFKSILQLRGASIAKKLEEKGFDKDWNGKLSTKEEEPVMDSGKKVFRSIHELEDPTLRKRLAKNEFVEEIPVDEFFGDEDAMKGVTTSRRDFLKFMGFSTAAATLAACEAPVIKSVPYVVKPHEIIPGVPNYYASTFFDGFDFASVLVKTREGRPIKIEPNPAAGSLGTTSARAQASVLSLYDNDKLKQPKVDGEDATYDKADSVVLGALDAVGEKKIVLLTHSMPSPTFKKLFGEFKEKYPTAELVVYEAYPYGPALDAAAEVFGKRHLPVYDLSETELVVSFGADFLGDYNGGTLQPSYAKARVPGSHMLRHIQVESNMSLTGANADTRIKQKPSQMLKTLAEVYKGLNGGTDDAIAKGIVTELQSKGSKAVVFAEGSKGAYVLAHLINQKLGSQAFTGKANLLKEYDPARFSEFMDWLKDEQVSVLITNDVNPLYSLDDSRAKEFKSRLENLDAIVAVSYKRNEMAQAAQVIIPSTHWLESWGDVTPQTGVYSLMQPTIQKIYKSRQIEESLLVWKNGKGAPENDYYEYLKDNASNILGGTSFNQGLYNGFNAVAGGDTLSYDGGDAETALAEIEGFTASDFEIALYTKMGVGDGTQANNPWLQELPDPITRMSWDNYLTISPKDAKKLDLDNDLNGRMQLDGSLVKLGVNGVFIEGLPVFIQPGQAEGSIGLALGYGQNGSGKVAKTGFNAYPLFDGNLLHGSARLQKMKGMHEFAGMQLQNTLMGRYEIAREVPLEQFINGNVNDWNPQAKMTTIGGVVPEKKVDLWSNLDDTDGPHFNLSIDMNNCIGCGACVIACQAENNLPVVGKDEIRMSRDMYWLRIDRYYTAKEHIEEKEQVDRGLNVPQVYDILSKPAENPDVIFQPVMCQHCNHAPCETVCPVAATSHGKQGQNMMAYNRCVGTRYCANNCPYKVRRFNWFNYALNDKFDYHMNNDLGRMVLNPDVVVRSRGVMEKCSMCIQKTQATILKAKKEGRVVKDEEFQTACSAACPTGAIQFGDMNDDKSHVRELFTSKRRYFLLEELGTEPNVFYHAKVRNRTV